MPFLQSVKDYTKRHRKGLFITAAIGGGSYLLGRYATGKLRDLQEKAMTERVAKENLKRRFQQNQNDCVFTVLSLLPTLGDQILYEMNIEAAWAKLQESRKLEKKEEKLKREQAEQQAQKEKEAQEAAATAEEEEEQEEKNKSNETQEGEEAKTSSSEKGKDETAAAAEAQIIGNTTTEEKPELENSVGSLGASTATLADDTQSKILEGILDKKAKYLLWEEIKTSSFTRTYTSIYSVTLLTLLTHIQLNLLGRFTYVWSVSVLNRSEPTIRLQHADEEPEGGFLDPQTERMFLSASWWLLHRGWRKCAERVKEAVEEVVGDISLKRIFKYEDAEEIVSKLRRRIEFEKDGTTPISYRTWMLPETDAEIQEFLLQTGFGEEYPKNADDNTATVSLKRLLDETKDYIDSPDFFAVLESCLDEVFAIFDHQAFAKALLPAAATMDFSMAKIQEVNDDEPVDKVKKVTLANLLPAISRQAHLVIAGNEYLNAFAYIKELQAFSAMIYTQYGEEVAQN
ncbi:Peroxin-3 [Phascolomyces articulosus]|uniref:Peroxin-3 n=1 Tax=Phascolomyces articulosus TaxID=60185 RepID=A0AAD5K4U9_9FUNG|nr:Peroxin-3 [Phascolomyces articulosus]